MSEFSERSMQAILLRWLLEEKHHEIAVPNSTVFFGWEADIASITRAQFSHEIEIKISKGDFARDVKDKPWKHQHLKFPAIHPHVLKPNYFWYCTPEGLEIDVPDYAGWLVVRKMRLKYFVSEKKPAPRLHKLKIPAEKVTTAGRLLAFRLMNEMWAKMQREISASAQS